MPVNENREYRSFEAPGLCGELEVEGYATTWDPYVLLEMDDGEDIRERIDPHAFDGADMSDVIMQYDHGGKVLARMSNGSLSVTADGHGLKIRADLSGSSAGRELREEIAAGLITKMSMAFTVDDEEYDRQTRTRVIKKIRKLYDVSAVSLPANPGTEISTRAWLDGVIEAETAERRERMRRALELRLRMIEI